MTYARSEAVARARAQSHSRPSSRECPTLTADGLGWRVSDASVCHGFRSADSKIGALERGKHADFILVDLHSSEAAPAQMREPKVLETWIGGQKIWEWKQRRSRPTPLDHILLRT